jgi:hypothetical protein
MRALFFLFLRRLASRLNFNQFARDSHRKSGVLSFPALLSPVDSCDPPELKELTVSLYARGMHGASEKNKKKRSHGYLAHPQQIDLWISRAPLSSEICFDFRRLVTPLVAATLHAKTPGSLMRAKKRPPELSGGPAKN